MLNVHRLLTTRQLHRRRDMPKPAFSIRIAFLTFQNFLCEYDHGVTTQLRNHSAASTVTLVDFLSPTSGSGAYEFPRPNTTSDRWTNHHYHPLPTTGIAIDDFSEHRTFKPKLHYRDCLGIAWRVCQASPADIIRYRQTLGPVFAAISHITSLAPKVIGVYGRRPRHSCVMVACKYSSCRRVVQPVLFINLWAVACVIGV